MTQSRHLKEKLVKSLEENDLDAVLVSADEDKQVLSALVRLAYDKETLVGRRAIEAIGVIARDRIGTDYPVFREMVRKQLWSLSDESGGIGWSAPEIIGEIVSADTARFKDIIPLIAEVYSIEEKVFRPGVLCALYRIAQADAAAVKPYLPLAIRGLTDGDPQVRIYSLLLLDALKDVESRAEIETVRMQVQNILKDRAEVWLYMLGAFRNVMIGECAQEVMTNMS